MAFFKRIKQGGFVRFAMSTLQFVDSLLPRHEDDISCGSAFPYEVTRFPYDLDDKTKKTELEGIHFGRALFETLDLHNPWYPHTKYGTQIPEMQAEILSYMLVIGENHQDFLGQTYDGFARQLLGSGHFLANFRHMKVLWSDLKNEERRGKFSFLARALTRFLVLYADRATGFSLVFSGASVSCMHSSPVFPVITWTRARGWGIGFVDALEDRENDVYFVYF